MSASDTMPVWLAIAHIDIEASTPAALAQRAHICAQEVAYTTERKQRLRSMAHTWALVSEAAVVAST